MSTRLKTRHLWRVGFSLAAFTCASHAFAQTAASHYGTIEGARITAPVSDGTMAILSGTHVALPVTTLSKATAVEGATRLGHLQLVLQPSSARRAALETLTKAQHDPASPSYRKWLTPEEYGDAFGVTPADLRSVVTWLRKSGFRVNSISSGRTLIDFSGTAAQVKAAFRTNEVNVSLRGQDYRVNDQDISVPAAMRDVVAGVMGLSSFHPHAMNLPTLHGNWNPVTHEITLGAKAGRANIVQPQAQQFYNGSVRGLFPADMRTIYGVNPLIKNGITGKGITVAVVEDGGMVDADWTNFVSVFGLAQFGGTYKQIQPQPTSGAANCTDPGRTAATESGETVLDAEYVTGLAPGANVIVAACGDSTTDNFFGGVFVAATNLINATSDRPNIISASYGFGERETDAASKTAIDAMWQQADAEGISVFVSSGDSGSNPSFNGQVISQVATTDANSLATSPHDTAVGGNDFSDIYEKKTGYFSPKGTLEGGSALSYVPEIPWNQSCANPIISAQQGFKTPLEFCQTQHKYDPSGNYITSEAGSGGPSLVDVKPAWQANIYGAVNDGHRDIPDVALFAGSYNNTTYAVVCQASAVCNSTFSNGVGLTGGTSLAAPMFAGIQALVDQGFVATGAPANQGNAAPSLYQLATYEYGTPKARSTSTLAACNATLGRGVSKACIFNNVQRGSIVTNCTSNYGTSPIGSDTPGCGSIYGLIDFNSSYVGLTTASVTKINPTLTSANAAYDAHPGWSFTSGLGSVNATTLLAEWRLLSLYQ